MKWGLPDEAAIILMFHAKEGEVEAGKVVVICAAIDKGGGQANLADILLDCEFWSPHWECLPALAKYGVVGHARVDVVLDSGFFCGIG